MNTNKIPVGTVGLGLMGCSIATCILSAGHAVTSVVRNESEALEARPRILHFLKQLHDEGLLAEDPVAVMKRHHITTDITALASLDLVIESITEDQERKRNLYFQLETVLASTAIIGSNTSAIPVTVLQTGMKHPERLLGIHWAEPAHITRFMEVICGFMTNPARAAEVIALARTWNKEPSLLRKDIRGFITNRIMYAMMREAFFLVENGYASIEDVDRSLRNDLGYWITFAGPFRFMDLTGIPAYLTVMNDLLPELDNSQRAPELIRELVASGARGVSNAKGFYPYTPESAKRWEELFVAFTYDIRKLAEKYPENIGDQQTG
jgi:3-hydroxybutyryl-CoA dehydrogenase